MAAPQCTRQGDAATRRSKQGVKTHTITDTLTFLCALHTQADARTRNCLAMLKLNSSIFFFCGSKFLLTSVFILCSDTVAGSAQWEPHYLQHLTGILCHPDELKPPYYPTLSLRGQCLNLNLLKKLLSVCPLHTFYLVTFPLFDNIVSSVLYE